MATITAVITKIPKAPVTAYHILWEALIDGDPGSAVEMVAYTDRSVQIIGTFSTTTCVLEGSNDGATWATLEDGNGDAITTAATGLLTSIGPLTRFIRPHITVVGSSPDIDVHVIVGGPVK